MASTLIVFSGATASGKSTLARGVADVLGWPAISFGNYVRVQARRRNLDDKSVPVLQALGEELVHASPAAFTRGVLDDAEWNANSCFTIDGLRHDAVLEQLKTQTFPSTVVHVHVTVDHALRKQRLQKRIVEGSRIYDQSASLAHLDGHSTETQTAELLRSVADLVVDGNGDLSRLVEEVVRRIGHRSH